MPRDPVFNLLSQGNTQAVRELLSTDRTLIHRLNCDDYSPLHYPLHIACMMGRKEMCEVLLTNGARYDLTQDHGRVSALDEANSVEVIKSLIR